MNPLPIVKDVAPGNPIEVVGDVPVDIAIIGPANWNPVLKPEEKAILSRYFNNQKASPATASMPLICKWTDCIYKHHCPLWQIQVTPSPLNKPCPVEMTIIDQLAKDYMVELQIGPRDITDLAILKEMISWQMLEKRALEELAADPKTIREAVIGIDPKTDEPITKEMMNPAITMLEKAGKMKQKLRESLIATREAKSKDTTKKQTTLSELAAKIQQKMEAQKLRARGEGPIIDVKVVERSSTSPAAFLSPPEKVEAAPPTLDDEPDFGTELDVD